MIDTTTKQIPFPRTVSTVAAAWLLAVGFDFVLHGGLLARLYVRESPFLLEPGEAFRRIPAGYLGFLVLTAALYWLLERVRVRDWLAGFRLGLLAGLVVWGALALGLFSVTTAPLDMLFGWWIGQSIELALSGAVIGGALGGTPMKTIWWKVVAVVVLLIAVTIAMQSAGLAPALKAS